MSFSILDGKGSGKEAQVSTLNKLKTDGISQTYFAYHTLAGAGYMVSTGEINLTTDGASAICYVKNNENRELVMDSFNVCQEATTGGTGNTLIELIKNPSTGTLISAGTAISAGNKNFGSANTLDADITKGAEGSTITNGTTLLTYYASTPSRLLYKEGPIVLEKGNSLAVRITPPTGSTNLGLCFSIQLYLKDAGVN
jgi:hypothetical protein